MCLKLSGHSASSAASRWNTVLALMRNIAQQSCCSNSPAYKSMR